MLRDTPQNMLQHRTSVCRREDLNRTKGRIIYLHMRRILATLAIGSALTIAAAAQVHGTPASITSIVGPNGFSRPGVPASVTSLGPRGFSGTPPISFGHLGGRFQPGFGFHNGFNNGFGFHHGPGFGRGFGHRGVPIVAVPVYGYYPWPAYPYIEAPEFDVTAVPQDSRVVVEEDETPGMTVFEHRRRYVTRDDYDRYGEHYLDDREAAREDRRPALEARNQPERAPEAKAEPAKEEPPAPPTVLVYRDGHRQEVRDYAIVDKTLYVLSDRTAKKIALDTIDLDATVKANEDRGVTFTVPVAKKHS
jgi:hypothetical protein